MFTGLIREIGSVKTVSRTAGGLRYAVSAPESLKLLQPGASVAVNGVCQTVVGMLPDGFTADAVSSTLAKTTLGTMRSGERVHLEPALRSGDPLDGHIMQGHVQTVGILVSVGSEGMARVLTIECPTGRAAGIVAEGSVGVDGISLTVSACMDGRFSVHIIPETWSNTVLQQRRVGSLLNIEGDILLRGAGGAEQPSVKRPAVFMNENKLREWGY